MELSSRAKMGLAILITGLVVGGVVGGVTYFVLLPAGPPVNSLEIYHWWTSGGEKAAIDALVAVFQEQYPEVAVFQTAVTGGAGFAMLPIIKSLVLAGEAPDAFQMHAGYEGKPYYDAGLLEQIDSLWTSSLKAVIPDVVESMNMFGGHYYSMPVNIHRDNVIWYNTKLLSDAGVDPTKLTNWTAFFTACAAIESYHGIHAISMGEAWTEAHAFEQICASIGIGFYEDWINGLVTNPSDTRLLQALTTFETFLSYVDPAGLSESWDAATARVINNQSAFNIMGDWANGEFLVTGQTYGVEYGTIPVPGTGDMYGLTIDCFQHPKGVKHPINSDRWLTVVSSKEGQDAFNPLKGSISARTDANLTKYGPYQQSAVSDFTTVTYMYPSIVHGSGAPEAFKVELNDIISAFVVSKDEVTAATAITAYTVSIASEYTVVWDLTP